MTLVPFPGVWTPYPHSSQCGDHHQHVHVQRVVLDGGAVEWWAELRRAEGHTTVKDHDLQAALVMSAIELAVEDIAVCFSETMASAKRMWVRAGGVLMDPEKWDAYCFFEAVNLVYMAQGISKAELELLWGIPFVQQVKDWAQEMKAMAN